MKKQTKVLLAAAMMTLGASFSALAATKGTWVLNDEGWQYADKEGEYVSNEWCKSNGIDFWVNDDEVLGASEWVTDSNYTYYVQSDGSKTTNAWKYLYAIDDEEEEDDQNWYYFDAKGRMIESAKKTIGGYDYYFDKDGKMLTGWVDAVNKEEATATGETIGNLVYANDNGQVVKSSWLHVFPWTETDGYEGEDEEYFYAKKDGKLAVTKTNVDDLTYFFNKDTGIMIEGWVEKVVVDANTTYYTASNGLAKGETAYWTNEIGYAAKNTWKELERATNDDKIFWFHFNKLGEVFIASDADAVLNAATFTDGEEYKMTASTTDVNAEILKIDGVEYYFNEAGEMIDGLQYVTVGTASNLMYFVDGAKQTGKVTLTDEYENDFTFMFAPKTEDGNTKYAAVTGNFDGYCYVDGQLVTAVEEDTFEYVDMDNSGDVSVGDFIVDHNGKIQKKTTKEYFTAKETYTFSTADNNTKNSIASIVTAQ